MDDLSALMRIYRNSMGSNKKVAGFYAKLRDGTATYRDMQLVSSISGDVVSKLLEDTFPNGIPPDAPAMLIGPAIREECLELLDDAKSVQRLVNRRNGIGLNPVDVALNEQRLDGLVSHISETGIIEETKNLIKNFAQSQVDDTMHANAKFQNDSGLEVTVSRDYDGVGLKEGACLWCLDRVGSNVPYAEAKDRGMFERHAGCGCILDYNAGRRRMRQADWTRNAWKDSDEILEQRRSTGL